MEHIELFFKSVFIDNMVFATFLGMCSYLAVSKKVSTAIGLGAAVTFVLAITVPLNWLLDQYILQDGALAWLHPSLVDYDLSFLSFIMFIATIATMVQLVEIIVEKFSPALYNSLGIFLPLIAVNCAILGGSLFMQSREIASIQLATTYGVGSGFGFFLAILAIFKESVETNTLSHTLLLSAAFIGKYTKFSLCVDNVCLLNRYEFCLL